ncbi:peptide MFS transporter [Corynebacterium epidermidicanis]|uniref:Amino acid/peptide transporter (Peptide:H symporter) n=1 Tax=Corynebacterium epidermidicanis TaxID=1050174 RepID=A0A0G3GWC2_9CORY|nr:oligopeptide:H+ symporter [Corynebacterium epidermidicanis]AKK03823.1 amino acid/peptide transporter (peptide:H symporter) [Corynebacterium epidermidicanis]
MSLSSSAEAPNDQSPNNQAGEHNDQERQFFGHPWGLANLFGVEMWERFSFYGLQGLLLYYLYYQTTEGGLGMDKPLASAIVGAYGGTVYLSAIVGGWVADRILGAEKTLFYSGILIMFGHAALAVVPGYTGMIAGLIAIALGAGCLKTTAGTVLGNLYSKEDPRRDSGFSIFYMGINIGGLIGPLVTGALWKFGNFHLGFGAAAVGMALGLIQYMIGRKHTITPETHAPTNPLPKKYYLPILAGVAAVIAVVWLLFQRQILVPKNLSDYIAIIATCAAIILFTEMMRSPLTEPHEKRRLIGFIPMFLGSVTFFTIFKQQFTVLAVYTDQRLNRFVGGFEITPTWIQSINPVFIIVFAGVFATLWSKMGSKQPSSPMKYALGTLIIGVAPLLFLPFAGGADNSTPFWVIVLVLFVFTMAELHISPVGLSMATKVAPDSFKARAMSLHLLSLSIGTALSGTFAGFYDPTSATAERTYFIALGGSALIIGVILLLLVKPVLKAFGGVR